MLSLIILICVGVVFWRYIECDGDLDWDGIGTAFSILLVIFVIAEFVIFGIFMNLIRTIPKQIAIYEEENDKIESQINDVVNRYMEYEKGIFSEVSDNESAITLVTLYPDLKSDELVKSQISIYVENNNKIKELKERQTCVGEFKFWLYFGK